MFTEAPAIGLAQELLGRFLGVNSELPKTGDKVKTGPRLKCFAQQFNQSGQSDTWAGATPQDPCYLTEVPHIIDKSKLIQNRADGRSTFPGGPQAPASVKYAVRDVARDLGPRNIAPQIMYYKTGNSPSICDRNSSEPNNLSAIHEYKSLEKKLSSRILNSDNISWLCQWNTDIYARWSSRWNEIDL